MGCDRLHTLSVDYEIASDLKIEILQVDTPFWSAEGHYNFRDSGKMVTTA